MTRGLLLLSMLCAGCGEFAQVDAPPTNCAAGGCTWGQDDGHQYHCYADCGASTNCAADSAVCAGRGFAACDGFGNCHWAYWDDDASPVVNGIGTCMIWTTGFGCMEGQC